MRGLLAALALVLIVTVTGLALMLSRSDGPIPDGGSNLRRLESTSTHPTI